MSQSETTRGTLPGYTASIRASQNWTASPYFKQIFKH